VLTLQRTVFELLSPSLTADLAAWCVLVHVSNTHAALASG